MTTIVDAAMQWVALKRVTTRLIDRRAMHSLCDRQMGIAALGGAQFQSDPCWKIRRYSDVADDEVPMPQAQWCQPCRDQQTYHDALTFIGQRRGAALRTLTRECRRELHWRQESALRQEEEVTR